MSEAVTVDRITDRIFSKLENPEELKELITSSQDYGVVQEAYEQNPELYFLALVNAIEEESKSVESARTGLSDLRADYTENVIKKTVAKIRDNQRLLRNPPPQKKKKRRGMSVKEKRKMWQNEIDDLQEDRQKAYQNYAPKKKTLTDKLLASETELEKYVQTTIAILDSPVNPLDNELTGYVREYCTNIAARHKIRTQSVDLDFLSEIFYDNLKERFKPEEEEEKKEVKEKRKKPKVKSIDDHFGPPSRKSKIAEPQKESKESGRWLYRGIAGTVITIILAILGYTVIYSINRIDTTKDSNESVNYNADSEVVRKQREMLEEQLEMVKIFIDKAKGESLREFASNQYKLYEQVIKGLDAGTKIDNDDLRVIRKNWIKVLGELAHPYKYRESPSYGYKITPGSPATIINLPDGQCAVNGYDPIRNAISLTRLQGGKQVEIPLDRVPPAELDSIPDYSYKDPKAGGLERFFDINSGTKQIIELIPLRGAYFLQGYFSDMVHEIFDRNPKLSVYYQIDDKQKKYTMEDIEEGIPLGFKPEWLKIVVVDNSYKQEHTFKRRISEGNKK